MADATPGSARPTPGRPDPRLAVAIVVVIAAAALTIGIVAHVRGSGSGAGSAEEQTSADPTHFDLPALTGTGHVRLSDYRGHPVVVNFFASWCTPCKGELPGFRHVRSQLGGAVTFIGVNSMETGDGAAFAREEGIGDWSLAHDVGTGGGALHDAVGGQGLPITVFFDGNGSLVNVHIGAFAEDDLRATLRRLFGVAA